MTDQSEDASFEALVNAAGVPLSEEEKRDLRKAYAVLAGLAHRARRPGRTWEVRMLPFWSPPAPGDDR